MLGYAIAMSYEGWQRQSTSYRISLAAYSVLATSQEYKASVRYHHARRKDVKSKLRLHGRLYNVFINS